MTSRTARWALLSLLAVVACAHRRAGAVAPGPIVTDRPDFTEATAVVAAGHVQAEGGYTLSGEGRLHEHSFGELLLRVGLAPRAELRLTSNYVVARAGTLQSSGMEDASVGAKLGFLDAAHGIVPATSIIVATSVPTGASAVSDGRATPEAKLVLGWDLPFGTSLGVNANWSRPVDERGRLDAHAWSASFGHGITERVGAYAEAFSLSEVRGGPAARFANGGLSFAASDALQFDVRAGAQLGGSHAFFTGVGISRRW